MTWLDYTLFAIIGLSALYSVFRGFVREMLSLLSWVMAFWIAIRFAPRLGAQLEGVISAPGVRFLLAFILLLLAVLVVAAFCSRLIAGLIRKGGFGGMDRLIGVGFGVVRGVVISLLLLMMARISPLAAEPVWQRSMSVVYFEQLRGWLGEHGAYDLMASYHGRLAGLRSGL